VDGGGMSQWKTREAAEGVLAPKVRGTLVLASVLEEEPLDFFVLCSSGASVAGGVGQADYCAANAFLDAFAWSQATRPDRLTVAINWDTWREIGMAVNTEVPAALQALREASLAVGIAPAEGVAVFQRVLACG